MLNIIYNKVKDFKKRYPLTISWRLKAHSKVAAEHVNDDEEVLYAFAAQKLPSVFSSTSCKKFSSISTKQEKYFCKIA